MKLELPVKPYSAKFLRRHLGESYQLSNSDIYGRYLFCLLRLPRDDKQYDNYLNRYTKKFPVRIVPYLITDDGCKNCSSQTIIHFNKMVEGVFYTEFHQFVQARVEDGLMEAATAIRRFSTVHQLTEDDIQFDTLKRSWNRYWRKEKKRLESINSPSGLSLAA